MASSGFASSEGCALPAPARPQRIAPLGARPDVPVGKHVPVFPTAGRRIPPNDRRNPRSACFGKPSPSDVTRNPSAFGVVRVSGSPGSFDVQGRVVAAARTWHGCAQERNARRASAVPAGRITSDGGTTDTDDLRMPRCRKCRKCLTSADQSHPLKWRHDRSLERHLRLKLFLANVSQRPASIE